MKKVIIGGLAAIVISLIGAPAASADSVVDRVIDSRGDVVCLTFRVKGLTQDSLDEMATYLLTVPATKLSRQQVIEVIEGSVETYCPEYSSQIAEVFG